MLNSPRNYKKRTHKFNARQVECNNIKFKSTLEKDYYLHLLKLRDYTKDVLFFLMQVPFHLPGGVKYICDFQVFYTDGTIEFIDTKGVQTPDFKNKKKIVEELYPVDITIKKRGEF